MALSVEWLGRLMYSVAVQLYAPVRSEMHILHTFEGAFF